MHRMIVADSHTHFFGRIQIDDYPIFQICGQKSKLVYALKTL